MARLQPTTDPYRILGVSRGATPAEVKAAHRRLAMSYHPDRSTGDAARFLAVQAAYQLLSDPVRRREWDRAHAPGPIRAAGTRRAATGAAPSRKGTSGRSMRIRRRPRTAAPRSRTWSASHVPWWEDFRPGTRPGPAPMPHVPDTSVDEEVYDFDVFDRSSGAAWSSAARRHFRRGTDDLPSRGVWRYRGTQVVTGAEARAVADEEEKKPPR